MPVIANARGCIADEIEGASGIVVRDDRAYLDTAAAAIRRWLAEPDRLAEASRAARQRAEALYARSQEDLSRLVGRIGGDAAGQPRAAALPDRAALST